MERVILFKGKRKDWESFPKDQQWVEGGYFQEPYTDKEFIICWNSTGLGYNEFIEVIPDTVSQFTGYSDKNREKIWENDIIRSPKRARYDGCKLYQVVWRRHYADFGVKLLDKGYGGRSPIGSVRDEDDLCHDLSGWDYIRCGNIFDNPELKDQEEEIS